VVGEDKTVAARPLEVQSTDTEFAVIRSGLKPGETVVTEGQFQLKPGALVETREPGENRDPGGTKGKGAGKGQGPAREARNP
jgi:multidrug efflux system membrane fusion protein